MSTIFFSRFYSLFISIALAIPFVPLYLRAQSISLTEREINIISANPDTMYIYLEGDNAYIREIILQLRTFDTNNSFLNEFYNYLEEGGRLIECDALVKFLECAESIFQKNKNTNHWRAKRLIDDIDNEITKTISIPTSLHILNLDSISLSPYAKRLVAKAPALVVATANVSLSGLQTIDGVSLAANDRVLLINQTNPVENGLWLAQAGSWTRPADFASTTLADEAYVLISSGDVNGGSSWLSITPLAVIDTDPITFTLFAYPDMIVGENVGTGVGLVFRDKIGNTLNFRSLEEGSDIIITNNADEIIIDTNATSANIADTIVKRDASGNFSADVISMTDAVITNSISITPFNSAGIVHNNSSGVLSSSLIVNADISASAAISDSKLATITSAGKVSNAATTANSANLANTIVARDGVGNFSAGTITANLNGNATSATTATTATTTTDFTGSLAGDVTGTQGATVVGSVGGQAAGNIASASVLANAATSNNTANAIIRRNASGNFSAGAISVTDAVMSSSLRITPFSSAGIVHNNASGLLSSSLIVNADVSPSAAIADTKLATISSAGKVANSATTATSLNTPNAIVARDASGNINASIIIGDLFGTASENVLKAGDTMTGNLQLPAGTASAPSLRFTGSTTAGLSTSAGNLLFSTNALERMRISSGGTISIKSFTSAGVVKNDASGNLSSSQIVDANIAAGAGILDTKIATISTPGKVANSATTATALNNASTIVSRDVSGNFAANKIDVVDVATSGNVILSTNPSTSTAGNVLKGTNTPFIHNFGTDNTFVGINAGNFTMTGSGRNSIFGSNAFGSNNSGDNNTAMGYIALGSCTTGSNNIAIGSGSGSALTTGSGNIYINANASSSSESSIIRLGTSQTQCYIAGIRGTATGNANAIAVLIDSAGQLGTISSSQKVKHDIEDMADASSDILNLRPVTFIYNNDKNNTKQYGLIAEEVDQIFPEIVVKDENGDPETIQYHILPVLLLNEMKKQQATIDHMKEIIVSLQNQIQEFIERTRNAEQIA